MPKKPQTEPLRGEAAYLARRAEIAKRNDATQARGAAKRQETEARSAASRLEAEQRADANVPRQPGR